MKQTLIFLFLCVGSYVCAKPLEVQVAAKSAILMNADTGMILFEKNPYEAAFPASITKIATALYILENKKDQLDEVCVADAEALVVSSSLKRPSYRLEPNCSHVGIKKGEKIPLRTLLYQLMLVSGNDAANVIAQWAGKGSIPSFMQEENEYLKSIGCLNTHFCNPHGLHVKEHSTTAYDMGKMTQKALQNPLFRKIVATKCYSCSATNRQPKKEIFQTNRLLKRGRFSYPPAIGVKTGYTSSAGYTLVAAAEQKGRVLIAVLLGCEKNEDRYRDAKKLFQKAFAEEKVVSKFFEKGKMFETEIKGGEVSLKASVQEDVCLEFYPSEEVEAKTVIHWTSLEAPIEKGTQVGEMWIVSSKEEVLKKQQLIAENSLKGTWFFRTSKFFKKLF